VRATAAGVKFLLPMKSKEKPVDMAGQATQSGDCLERPAGPKVGPLTPPHCVAQSLPPKPAAHTLQSSAERPPACEVVRPAGQASQAAVVLLRSSGLNVPAGQQGEGVGHREDQRTVQSVPRRHS
jgi:hypothetical protein